MVKIYITQKHLRTRTLQDKQQLRCSKCHNTEFNCKFDKKEGKLVFICAKCDNVIY